MKFFNYTTNCTQVGDGTAGDLAKWIQAYISACFPDNHIDYWSDNKFGDIGLKSEAVLKDILSGDKGIHHIDCHTYAGSCEGRRIVVGFSLRDGRFINLVTAKSFGNHYECLMICAAVTCALEEILFFEQLPMIVDLYRRIPKATWWERKSSIEDVVIIDNTDSKLTLRTDGLVLEDIDFSEHGKNAKFHVEALLKDWVALLKNMEVKFEYQAIQCASAV